MPTSRRSTGTMAFPSDPRPIFQQETPAMTTSQHDHALGILPRKGRRAPVPSGPGFRPRLEGLEDRTVLSTLTVLNPLDTGRAPCGPRSRPQRRHDRLRPRPRRPDDRADQRRAGDQKASISRGRAPACWPSAATTPAASSTSARGLTVTIAGLTITHGRLWGIRGAAASGTSAAR